MLKAGVLDKVGADGAREIQKYAFVDALRGIAILGVLLVHSGGRADLPEGLLRTLVGEARFGVQLFYMVSAFTLYLSFDSRREAGFGAFFIRRFFRLAPMYWLTVFLFCLYAWATDWRGIEWAGGYHFQGRDVGANLLLLHGLLPSAINTVVPGGWSVGVEWLFYALLPLIYMQTRNLAGALTLAGLAMGLAQVAHYPVFRWLETNGMAWGLTETTQQVSDFMNFYLVRQLPCFLLGVVAYYLIFPGKAKPARMWVANLTLLLWLFILGSFATNVGLFAHDNLAHEFVLCGAYLLLFFLLRQASSAVWIVGPLGLLGRLSYSVYLLHFLVLDLFARHLIPLWLSSLGSVGRLLLTFGSCLLVTTLLAWVTHHWVERPGLRLSARLVARFQGEGKVETG